MKVAVPSIMSQAGKDYLTSRGFELIETKSQSAAALVKEAADADGIILMTEPFPNTLADQLPKLKVIARHGVGYDNIDPESLKIWSPPLSPCARMTGDGHLLIKGLICPVKRWELSAMVASAA